MMHDIIQFVGQQLATNQIFSGAALASILMGGLYSLKSVPKNIWDRIYRRINFSATIEQTDYLYKYFDMWVQQNYSNNFRQVEVESSPIHRWYLSIDNTPDKIKLSHQNDFTYIWHKRRYIRISKTKTKLESAHDVYNAFSRNYNISGIFAKKAILSLLQEVFQFGVETELFEKEQKRTIKLYEHNSYGEWRSSKVVDGKKFESLFFEEKECLINDLDNFLLRKPAYEKLHIPFKRGYLFYGVPGNGKSSIAFAMAEYLKYDIYVINPGVLTADSFPTAISNIPSNSILLIEDIDAFYKARKAVNGNKINFSSFINTLSGVEKRENLITIFTTNHVDSLDPALTRAGRCDFKLELRNPNAEILSKFLSHVTSEEIILKSTYKNNKSFAQIQNICMEYIEDIPKMIENIQKS